MLGIGGIDTVSLGQLGTLVLQDTTAVNAANNTVHKRGWGIIEAQADTTFAVLTIGKTPAAESKLRVDFVTFIPNLAAFTLPKGQRIYGFFTAITLNVGGKIIAYEV